MSIRENLSDVVDNFDDWILESDSAFTGISKLVGVTVAGLAIIVSPYFYYRSKLESDMQENCKALDHTTTVIFTSIDDCVQKNHSPSACQCSWEKAKEIADDLPVSYSSEETAAHNHQQYETVHYKQSHLMMVGKVPITTYTNEVRYDPHITGWQATQNDICNISMPLYSGPQPNTFVRSDMNVLELR